MVKDFLQTKTMEKKIGYAEGKIKDLRSGEVTRSGARIFQPDGRMFSFSKVGEGTRESIFAEAERNASYDVVSPVIPRSTSKGNWECGKNSEFRMAALEETLISATKFLERELPDFSAQGSIIHSTSTHEYSNTLGAMLTKRFVSGGMEFELRKKGSPNILDGFLYQSLAGDFRNFADFQWPLEMYKMFTNEQKITNGKKVVMTVPDYSALNFLCESAKAETYHLGNGLYSGKLKEKLFSDRFSLVDQRILPEKMVLSPFDGDGELAPAETFPIIADGVFTNLLSDIRTEKKFDVKSTGNGFRATDSNRRLSAASLGVVPGKRSFREILKDHSEVIVCVMCFGGDLTPQGDFSTPIQLGFLVKNGQVAGRIPAASYSTNLAEMFGGDLLEVARDAYFSTSSNPYLFFEAEVQTI
jgi:PmbA protein